MIFEPVATAITIVLIAVILTVYASVPKRNGWIGKPILQTGITRVILPALVELKTQHSDASTKATKVKTEKQKQEPKISSTDTPGTKPKDEDAATQRSYPEKTDLSQINRPEGCNHHFGYLATLPKGTNTPDECYSCTDLINCYKKTKNPKPCKGCACESMNRFIFFITNYFSKYSPMNKYNRLLCASRNDPR